MTTWLNPYLIFRDTAADALAFYQGIFGGKLDTLTFGAAGAIDPAENPAGAERLMHGHLETADGWTFMASDGGDVDPRDIHAVPVYLSIGGTAADYDKATAWFAALAEGGTVVTPLERQMWGDVFGQVRDRFGVSWMVNIPAPTIEDAADH